MFFRFSGQLLSEAFFILRITEGDTIKNAYWYSCKIPRYYCPILMEFEFSRQISEKYSNTMKISPVVDKFFHHADRWTEGRTNMTKLIVAFRSFAKGAKIKKKQARCSGFTRVFTMPSHIPLSEHKKNFIRSFMWVSKPPGKQVNITE